MSLIGVHAVPVVNAVTCSLKLTEQSKIGFDPAADSIRIRSTKIGFDPNSVLESVRTLLITHEDVTPLFTLLGTIRTGLQPDLSRCPG